MKFVIRKSKNKQFYFILKARNGKTIIQSETYKTIASCWKAIAVVRLASSAWVVDETKKKDK